MHMTVAEPVRIIIKLNNNHISNANHICEFINKRENNNNND